MSRSIQGTRLNGKMQAFLETMKELEIGAVTNLVALGDSNWGTPTFSSYFVEMEAVKHLATKFPRALLKTVKFREVPTPEELVKQLTLVNERFQQICTNAKNLTIRLERRPKRPSEYVRAEN